MTISTMAGAPMDTPDTSGERAAQEPLAGAPDLPLSAEQVQKMEAWIQQRIDETANATSKPLQEEIAALRA